MKQTPAQIALIIAALTLLVEPLGDGWLGLGILVENHIGSSVWPDHAKFHVIRQGFACIFTGLLCAWGLLRYWDRGQGVRRIFALIIFLVNGSALLAIFLAAPVFGVENPVSQKGLGVLAVFLSLLLVVVGLFLEARERNNEHGSNTPAA